MTAYPKGMRLGAVRAQLVFTSFCFFFLAANCPPAFAERSESFLFKIDDKLDLDTVKDRKKTYDRDDQGADMKVADDATDGDLDSDDSFDRYAKLRKAWTSDFVDTDFSATDFSDLKNLRGKGLAVGRPDVNATDSDRDSIGPKDDDHKDYDSSIDLSDDRDDEMRDFLKSRIDYDKKKIKREDREKYKELTRDIPGVFHDWVPSPVDRLQNGGFTGEPGNGYPVPYNLNGFIEIERKLPWEAAP
jgi:hypothetical protein